MFLKKISGYIRFFILKTGNFSSFNKIYLLFYKISLVFIVQSLNKLRKIKAICLEGSLAQDKTELKAGSTDIDLIIITDELSIEDELKFIYSYIKKCLNLKRLFPFLKDHRVLNKSTAPIHSYAKTLGPYHFKQYNRLYRVIYGRIPEDIFPREPDYSLESFTAVDLLILARTILRPVNEAIFDASTSNKAYIRNSILGIKRVLDYVNVNMQDFSSKLTLNQLNGRIKIIADKNFFINPGNYPFFISTINDLYRLLEECLNYMLPYAKVLNTSNDNKISLAKQKSPNETLTDAISEIREKIKHLYEDTKDTLYNISILPEYNCNYQYTIYLVFRNKLEPCTLKNIYATLKNINFSVINPSIFYSRPIVITKELFELNKRYVEACCGPLDLLLFNKLLYKISGEDLNNDINEASVYGFLNTKLYGNILKTDYNYLIESHNIFEKLIENLENKDTRGIKKTIDYLLGAATSQRLAVEKGIITAVPLEAFSEYTANYPHDKMTQWYESFYQQFYTTKTELSIGFIKSQIKDLFCFYSQNTDITDKIVRLNLENNPTLHPVGIPHHKRPARFIQK